MSGHARTRGARPADRDRLLSLWIDLLEHHRRLDPDYPTLPGIREALLLEIDRGLRGRSCRLLVAEFEGVVVGFAFAEVESAPRGAAGRSGTGWIHELYVEPSCRERGLGRALVSAARGFLAERGGARTAVRVESVNAEGLAFWRRLGFAARASILEKEKA